MIGNADKILFSPDRDNCTEPFITLKRDLEQIGYRCEGLKDQPIDEISWVLFWDAASAPPDKIIERIKYKIRMFTSKGSTRDLFYERGIKENNLKTALLLFEPPCNSKRNWDLLEHQKFDIVFTWYPNLIDNLKYFRIYLPIPIPVRVESDKSLSFKDRKLLAGIISNKQSFHEQSLYKVKIELITHLDQFHPHDFDLFGFDWNPSLFRFLHMWLKGSRMHYRKIKNYRGTVKSKWEIYAKYRFAICYENSSVQGYVSEKIFDAMVYGCVPIYLGAPDILKYIPSSLFVDRREFQNNLELYDFLNSMSEKKHSEMVSAGLEFLSSDSAKKFFSPSFSKSIISKLY